MLPHEHLLRKSNLTPATGLLADACAIEDTKVYCPAKERTYNASHGSQQWIRETRDKGETANDSNLRDADVSRVGVKRCDVRAYLCPRECACLFFRIVAAAG